MRKTKEENGVEIRLQRKKIEEEKIRKEIRQEKKKE